MELAGTLDAKERRALRRVGMPLSVVEDPWIRLDTNTRDDAVEAWRTLLGAG